MIADDDDLLRRAFAAYFRNAGVPSPDQPSNGSYVTDLGGKRYVVLTNIRGVLAVYRVRNDGLLKGLRRWPKALES